MIRGLYTAALGMISNQTQQENLSNNISNSNTPGYKQENLSLKSFDQMVIEHSGTNSIGQTVTNKLGKMEFGVGIDQTSTDFTQGTINSTGRNLDFAINGNGFFSVLDSNGVEKYTRAGSFQIDNQGYVVDPQGDKVLFDINGNTTGQPLKVNGSDIQLNSDGTIKNGSDTAKFHLVKFTDSNNQLVRDSYNCYTSKIGEGSADTDSKVTQGSLENSNVDTIDAITQMISIMRNYESNQKVLQAEDDALGKSVNDVGSVK